MQNKKPPSYTEWRGIDRQAPSSELTEWVKYMSKLHKQSISLLKPGRTRGLGKGAMEIAEIMKYQGINEAQMQEAIRLM